jgi:hypothetical protein
MGGGSLNKRLGSLPELGNMNDYFHKDRNQHPADFNRINLCDCWLQRAYLPLMTVYSLVPAVKECLEGELIREIAREHIANFGTPTT